MVEPLFGILSFSNETLLPTIDLSSSYPPQFFKPGKFFSRTCLNEEGLSFLGKVTFLSPNPPSNNFCFSSLVGAVSWKRNNILSTINIFQTNYAFMTKCIIWAMIDVRSFSRNMPLRCKLFKDYSLHGPAFIFFKYIYLSMFIIQLFP